VTQSITSYLDKASIGGEAELSESWHAVVDDVYEMAVALIRSVLKQTRMRLLQAMDIT
jgi:hypothetical protein